jgi:hypothetical protein
MSEVNSYLDFDYSRSEAMQSKHLDSKFDRSAALLAYHSLWLLPTVTDTASVGSNSSHGLHRLASSVASPPSSSSHAGFGGAGAEGATAVGAGSGAAGSVSVGSGNKQRRRKMVADCKAMRVQVTAEQLLFWHVFSA